MVGGGVTSAPRRVASERDGGAWPGAVTGGLYPLRDRPRDRTTSGGKVTRVAGGDELGAAPAARRRWRRSPRFARRDLQLVHGGFRHGGSSPSRGAAGNPVGVLRDC